MKPPKDDTIQRILLISALIGAVVLLAPYLLGTSQPTQNSTTRSGFEKGLRTDVIIEQQSDRAESDSRLEELLKR